MGRKDNTDRKKGGFKKGGAKIGKKYEQRGGQRVRDNSQGGKKKFNNGASGGGKPARRDRPVEDTRKDYKVKGGKSGQKPIKGNKGQFSHMVGKSLFKLIPQGNGKEFKKDKFAALNPSQDEEEIEDEQGQEEDEYQEQMEEGEEEQENEEQIQAEEEQMQGQDEQQQQAENDQNQFQGDVGQQQYEGEPQQQAQDEQNNVKEQEGEQQPQIVQEQDDKNIDISVISLKIQETLQVLMNLPKLGQGKPRKYFVDRLKAYIHRYYGYNYELIDHFLNFLNPAEMIQFFQANQTQRPLTIRTNTLKTRRKQLAQALIQRGVNLDPLAEWSKVGIKIYETKVPIGATPEYLAGHYMLQSASSFLPVLALDPQMNQKILDMASAPGGKTSYIAQIMKNTGAIFANDLKKDRLKALQFNIYRLGITNTVITCRDGRKYPQIFPNTFDRVLLDAPCTGLGIISKDHSIKSNRMLLDIYKNSHVQKQLLLAAIDCTRVGGVVVYSTCSVSPIENEQVINYALKKRYVKIVDMDDLVEVGDAGLIKFVDKRYHVDLRKTKRIYPHVHNMDGFYLGKLVKMANGKRENKEAAEEEEQEGQEGVKN